MTADETIVRVAQAAVRRDHGTLRAVGLGSCVAILLYDSVARTGAMAHVLLPDPSAARDRSNPAKFATTAVDCLVSQMLPLGAELPRIHARLVGGASMFSGMAAVGSLNMGARNIAAARSALQARGIPLRREVVGAKHGRSIRFTVSDGRVVVSAAMHDDVVI
ncbi:MAG TPA: chemotaxis protein CheD [Longimicrobiaceae bacterium]|nr:chemotaxis protein CheD [Longimicrobiaceae bacterium]